MIAHGALLVLSLAALPPGDITAMPQVEELEVDGVKGLRASFYVQGPPAHVLDTLWDVKRFKSIFPDIKTLEVVREGPLDGKPSIDVKFFVDAVLADVTYTLRRTRTDDSVRWQSIAGDIRFIRGSWTVKPTDDPSVSFVIYESFVDVAVFVPTSVARNAAMKKTNEMAGRVRAAMKPAVSPSRRGTDAAATAPRPLQP